MRRISHHPPIDVGMIRAIGHHARDYVERTVLDPEEQIMMIVQINRVMRWAGKNIVTNHDIAIERHDVFGVRNWIPLPLCSWEKEEGDEE